MIYFDGKISTKEQVIEFLCHQTKGIVLIDGASGSGKSSLINEMRKRQDTTVIPSAALVDKIVSLLQIGNDYEACKVIVEKDYTDTLPLCLEDIDYSLKGKTSTTRLVKEIIMDISKSNLVILTGINIRERLPALVTGLEYSEVFM